MDNKKHLEDVLDFIREHRSNESNFGKLYEKLLEESRMEHRFNEEWQGNYRNQLLEISEKQVVAYQQSKEENSSAWPEFEKFVSHFERSIAEALKDLK